MTKGIDKLIINSPYEEPKEYWRYDRERRRFLRTKGRRPAGYIKATPRFKGFDDPGVFHEIKLVNKIRQRVKSWREDHYPGVTGVTKRLLEHWRNHDEKGGPRFFFCQLEAIETLIWLTEAPDSEKTGLDIGGDGGGFERWCSKMATGSGKTVIMSMIIAWNFLNKVANAADPRFSKNVLVVSPGLTVKNRLQVLKPSHAHNYYEEFDIVPAPLMDKLRRGEVLIHNWHALSWDSQEKIDKRVGRGYLRSVDKRQRIEVGQAAYVRNVLGDMVSSRNIIVINDEAHHAWRRNPEAKGKYRRMGSDRDSAEEATVWVGGLDKVHNQIGILRCFDLSATPFSPSGGTAAEETLFPWIVSDFGLNDAVESGLVKTPRVAVRDDSIPTKELRSRLYHIYMDPEVKDDVTRKAEAEEPLPDLIKMAYCLLGADWKEAKKTWKEAGHEVPPVMITVANRTETSARIKYAFDHGQILIKELCDKQKILQIDSKILKEAEAVEEEPVLDFSGGTKDGSSGLNQKQRAELLRKTVDTVGKKGEPGEQIQNVISVGMLSEGWDAKTVTHIMGLRAFSSQLLCEQVVGRGLRRVSYDTNEDGFLEAEYVNVFGVPFTFLPHEESENGPPSPPKPKTRIEPATEKAEHEIVWPNIIRIDNTYKPVLTLDVDRVKTLRIDAYELITEADLEAIIDGSSHPVDKTKIGVGQIAKGTRLQTIIFQVASLIYSSEPLPEWKGSRENFLAQLVGLVEQFILSDKIKIRFSSSSSDETKHKIAMILDMNRIVRHLQLAIRSENAEKLVPVFDSEQPVKSTADVLPWYTGKPCEWMEKSHISHCVYDSTWETSTVRFMDRSALVGSFVKNDHLGFSILYVYNGVVKKYYPDFILRLNNGEHLILEIKGQDDQKNRIKREFLGRWVQAVNEHGGFGNWHSKVSFDPGDVEQKIRECII